MDMVNLFEKLGIPVGLLLIMAWGFWQSVSWFGNKVVVPLQESHVRFLTSLEDTLKTLAIGQDQLAKELGLLTKLISEELGKDSRIIKRERND
jgi:hypothetical protein